MYKENNVETIENITQADDLRKSAIQQSAFHGQWDMIK